MDAIIITNCTAEEIATLKALLQEQQETAEPKKGESARFEPGMILINISNLCRERKISIARLERETGLGNATIRGWAESSPTVDNLKRVGGISGQ